VPANIVDWILIELHDAVNVSTVNSGTLVETQAAFLLSDGSVKQTDGNSFPEIDYTLTEQLFVIIRHRNHLDVLSANPLNKVGDNYVYDFSSGPNQVYGELDGCKELAPGIFGMVSGDASADGTINDFDKTEKWEMETGLPGYLPSDLNMDGESNNLDKNEFWLDNFGANSQMP
jgi:hypothetical protein